MEFLLGAAVACAVIYFLLLKRKVDSFNRLCELDFPLWYVKYRSSMMPEKAGIARGFLVQSLHLAPRMGALSAAEVGSIEAGLKLENPVSVVEGWLDTVLHDVTAVCGEDALGKSEARLVGVMMLVCLKSVNPQGELRRFIDAFNQRYG